MRDFEERLDPQVLASMHRKGAYVIEEGWTMNPTITIEDYLVPVPDAPELLIRVFHLAERDDTPASVIYFIHGGGFISGSHTDMQNYFEKIILATGAVVIGINYRLAPNHPFPAAFNDCYAALEWIASQGKQLHIDLNRLVICGASAGGALASAIAMKARDENGPDICYQILWVPVTDDRSVTPSSSEITDERVVNTNTMKSCWNAYLGEDRSNVSPYAAPARATDLSGLPPAYVLVEELDPLRDEGIEYAMRLMQHGVSTELHVFSGLYHGAFYYELDTDVAQRVLAEQIALFKRIFCQSS